MTEETLKLANNKMQAIKEVKHHMNVVQQMMNLESVTLYSEKVGSITLRGDVEADVLATVYRDQEEWLEELQDDFRRL
jgi:arabinogalactan endo-1,4-beta-galactosidase